MFTIYKNLLSDEKFEYNYFITNKDGNIAIYLAEPNKKKLFSYCNHLRIGNLFSYVYKDQVTEITPFEFFTNQENEKYLNVEIKENLISYIPEVTQFKNSFLKELHYFFDK